MLRLRSSRNSIVLFQNYALEQASELQFSIQRCHWVKYNWYDDEVIRICLVNVLVGDWKKLDSPITGECVWGLYLLRYKAAAATLSSAD